MDKVVAIRKCIDYNPCEVLNSIEWLYKEAKGPDPAGKKVLVKPNILSDDDPGKATTTHPVVVEGVIRYLKSRGATVFVGDSPTFDNIGFTGKKSGIRQVTESCGATWIRFNENGTTKKAGNGTIKVTSVVDEMDLIISLPKLKTHELMFFTGAIKNIFGLVPGFNKGLQHVKYSDREKLAEFFVDLVETIKPHFHIMDGIIGMDGPGPGNGYPKKVGVLLASANPLAIDIIASKIIGYDPLDIPTNRIALRRGIFLSSINDIEIKGPDPETLLIKNFRKIKTGGVSGIVLKSLRIKIPFLRKLDKRPVFNPELCIGCLKCVEACPVTALSADKTRKNTILLNDPLCIRCYCCHEVCRDRAIDIRRKIF